MDTTLRILAGAALVAGGLVLALIFGDDEFLFFRGQPLGVVLVVIGLLDLGDLLLRPRRRPD